MEIRTFGVIGAGQMGAGIATVAAQTGFQVIMRDIEQRFVDGGMANITKGLQRQVAKGRMTQEEMDEVLGRIRGTVDMAPLAEADFVVEAAIENIDLKKEIFTNLDQLCRPEVVLATNTSSISITEIGASTGRPDKVIGMHFMNPVPVMKLVEIIRGLGTSDETYQTVHDMAERMGKRDRFFGFKKTHFGKRKGGREISLCSIDTSASRKLLRESKINSFLKKIQKDLARVL
jgi:3-hydroxybutyryl-CoA dehydrogenase